MEGWRWFLLALAGGTSLLVTGEATATTFSISPLRISLPPDGRAEVLRVQNQGREPILLQVEAVSWDSGIAPDAPVRTPEVLALPPVVEIGPEAEQIIRLALRRPLEGETERAYRLWISEVPRTVSDGNHSLLLAVRFSVPMFATPQSARPDPVWTIAEAADGGLELVLRNHGQAHLRVSKIALHAPGGAVPVATMDEIGIALAGKEHSWRLERQVSELPQTLQVRAETQIGELVMPLTYTLK